ncbi:MULTISPECIES: DNA polymerase III subunit theta [Providencia]|uniref:DNA polymerase III subunit theta n=3 Tax=Providencia alcalifaciens TaxID=126385 RepID=A0AAW9VBE4_9GAMM|nr:MULTISPECIES: DNA polymerase III subunit theta [Providencia]ATG17341.1 DNA polymerase III subunit theta [Providencia alcalifaciens]EEB46005.1 DNA polymerase III subunit theta [Providencia alcalifaciens DSM 30120]EKT66644.1 DNA polymerase III subunit theta [Providencia alcalifaciens Dmel2]ETT05183.1 DNA polymerase III subunit theta [Providencia alcalifaciens F90-2004]EUC94839.1 DNA polymerase III subunit theta [Providencia alcalifaciens PAL-2]
MSHNLAILPKDEMDKINVDLLASGVAFKERYNIPIIPEAVEREQPEHLRDYFRERLVYYRQLSMNFARMPYEPRNR